MKAPATVLLLVSAGFASPALAQIPPMKPQFQVSQSTLYFQSLYGVAMDRSGEFVVTWASYNDGDTNYDCLGRLYDEKGTPLGPQFDVSPSANIQLDGAVAKDAEGRFVVVWLEAANNVAARRFDRDGAPLGDTFPVTVLPYGAADPWVASDDSGNFVVTWTREYPLGSFDVAARLFDSNGVALTGEFVVNDFTTGTQRARSVARKAPGKQFVITWGGAGTGGPGIWARAFDVNGNPNTGEIKVNQGLLLFALSSSSVAMNSAGEFVVAWSGFLPPSYEGVFARRYDEFASPLGNEFPVTAATSANRSDPQVASDHAGNFIVTWTADNGDGDGAAVGARLYDRSGTPITPEFTVNETTAGSQYSAHVALNDAGTFAVAWDSPDGSYYGVFGRRSAGRAAAQITVETANVAADNAVLEPGESVIVKTVWVNETAGPLALTGSATAFDGPPGATYTLGNDSADYGFIASGTGHNCITCYDVTVSAPVTRPVQHWDTRLQEATSWGIPHTWVLHVGESFPDVPTANIFYLFIENLFHNGVTGGCAGGGYCPTNPVTRAQMAVFLLKSKFGAAHIPPPCIGTVFTDVPCTGGPFDPWIEELASLQITGGCGGGLYCPNNTVTRQQMAVFLLKAFEGSTYLPPTCTGVFNDVTCPSQFADWIEELAARGITGGCSVTPPLYCPTNPNNRGQMAVFLVKTFGLALYGG